MRLTDYLDKGASLGEEAPCLTLGERTLSYGQVQALSYRVARALQRSGVEPGDKVAILSGNDPLSFACVFGIARAGAVWCPINPRNEAAENREVLDAFDCTLLLYQHPFAGLVAQLRPTLSKLKTWVCLDGEDAGAQTFEAWTEGLAETAFEVAAIDDVAMLVGTGGTTGRPKGVLLTPDEKAFSYVVETYAADVVGSSSGR